MVINLKVDGVYKRADIYISSKLELSRSRIQDLIKAGKILLNHKNFKPASPLKYGDLITGEIKDELEDVGLKPFNYHLKILYEDDWIIVIDKEKGMVVHPAKGHKDDTIVNALLSHCKDLKGISGELRPGIVHRLDKDTSGLMVVAKDEKSYNELQRQFKERLVEKKYLALIYGAPKKMEDTIITAIGRSESDRKKFTVKKSGKEAITHYKVLKTNGQVSLLEVNIKTGRTHQIRVHMNYIGHPIVGDLVYGKKNYGNFIKDKQLLSLVENIKGQALVSYLLGFSHPITQKNLSFKADIPLEMKKIVDYINKNENCK